MLKDIVVKFTKGILEKNRGYLDWVESGPFEIASKYRHDYRGFNPLSGGFCNMVAGDFNLRVE